MVWAARRGSGPLGVCAMTYLLYDIVTSLALPFGAAWLGLARRHRPLLRRFAPVVPSFSRRPIWVHACSVGEVGAARPILAAMRGRWPDVPILLTTATVTGNALAESACADVARTWFPFDHRVVVSRFVGRLRPRALVLIETEVWPNVLREASKRGIPSVVVNGRLSDKHFARYLRHASLFRTVFGQISAAGMQNAEYAGRIVALGMGAEAVRVTGNTKFDGVRTEVASATLALIRESNGFGPDQPLLLFGSTRPGDEVLAAACWRTLRDEFPSLGLVVAPRHLDRLGEALAPFDEPVIRRSEIRDGRAPAGERVLFLDTMGELADFYAAATVAVIGGSFYSGVDGHNPLESAARLIPSSRDSNC